MFRGFTAISHLLVVKRQHFENTFRHKYENKADALFICCIYCYMCLYSTCTARAKSKAYSHCLAMDNKVSLRF